MLVLPEVTLATSASVSCSHFLPKVVRNFSHTDQVPLITACANHCPSFQLLQTNKSQQQFKSHILSLHARTIMTGVSRRLARAPVLSVAQAEGAGATVRRSIGGAACRNFTPFLLLDDFTVGKGAGFPDHPHRCVDSSLVSPHACLTCCCRGMTTVTYMLEGYVQHEDSKGHKGTIGPGELQFMQAGKGSKSCDTHLHAALLINTVTFQSSTLRCLCMKKACQIRTGCSCGSTSKKTRR